jgi:hypothetical protein
MTSDSDDLAKELEHNLKLRSELAAKVDKAAKEGGGFGTVLYWICGIAAALLVAVIVASAVLDLPATHLFGP